ncbi:redoxin domain-containing protein [Phormidium tenue FACHB-886]|nr:redoxin domain-containing protein [Phormidium tenue FACHB-886]
MLTASTANTILMWIMILLNLLLTLALIRQFNQISTLSNMEIGLEKGSQAPDFKAETLSGESVTLSSYLGKAVSFIFVSPHCSACVDKLAKLNALAAQMKQSGKELVLVNTDGDRDTTASFVEKYQLALPILVAPFERNPFASTYKANATPSYCTLNPESYVEASGVLESDWEAQLI